MAIDPFERHGINHLSPSSLRLFREEPAIWIAKYMLRLPDESGPAAWRGRAVEAGIDRILFDLGMDAAKAAMTQEWNECFQGELDDDTEKEMAALPDFLAQAYDAFQDLPLPLTRQARMSLTIPGIAVPIVGYADWLWPDHGTDLKTTWRLPSEPDPNHVQQVACYSMYHGVPFSLTYVTPKKWARYNITTADAALAYDQVVEAAHAIRSMLAHVGDGYDALTMFAPNYDSYFYKRGPMADAIRAAKAKRTTPGELSHTKLEAVK